MHHAIIPVGSEKMTDRFRFAPGRRFGNFIFVSGQIGTVGRELAQGIEAQIDAAFSNVEAVLKAEDTDLNSIADITSYHVGDVAEHLRHFVSVLKRRFGDHFPAWTAVGATGLAAPGALVEIKATAIVDS